MKLANLELSANHKYQRNFSISKVKPPTLVEGFNVDSMPYILNIPIFIYWNLHILQLKYVF
jgi:hypothetical protein